MLGNISSDNWQHDRVFFSEKIKKISGALKRLRVIQLERNATYDELEKGEKNEGEHALRSEIKWGCWWISVVLGVKEKTLM